MNSIRSVYQNFNSWHILSNMFAIEVFHELLHIIDYNIFIFHKYNACNYIPHNAFFMNSIKGMEITFKFKQMYEKNNHQYFIIIFSCLT
jgi:hypothetical protein